MSWIKAYEPVRSLDEAASLLAAPGWAVIGGGSRLVARRPAGIDKLVDLMPLGLDRITVKDGELLLESRVRLQDLVEREDCGGLLKQAALSLAHSENLRNQMTVAGETAWPAPVSEWQTVLTVLGAAVCRHGRKPMPVQEYLAEAKHDGIITALTIPLEPDAHYGFDKVAPGAGARPLLLFAGAARIHEGRLAGPHLVLGNLGPHPQRLHALEKRLDKRRLAELRIWNLLPGDREDLVVEPSADASVESKWQWAEAMIKRFLTGLAAPHAEEDA
jgi:CO/xanthine dehydrogenase FAD-binding subunit